MCVCDPFTLLWFRFKCVLSFARCRLVVRGSRLVVRGSRPYAETVNVP